MLIRVHHVLRLARDNVVQEPGGALDTRLRGRPGHENDALHDAALFVSRPIEGSLYETCHQIAALLIADRSDARELMELNDALWWAVPDASSRGGTLSVGAAIAIAL